MGDRIKFAVIINHGGRFEEIECSGVYIGGKYDGRFELDPDTFGFFDVKDLVEELGYTSWAKLCFHIPSSNTYMIIKSDKEVMDMLAYLTENHRVLNIYVDRGIMRTDDVVHDSREDLVEVGIDGTGHETDLGSDEECEYIPTESDKSDDNLDDVGLASDDEEYLEARRSKKTKSNIFDLILEPDKFLPPDINQDYASEYDESDGDVYSSETEDEGESVKVRRKRSIYDPKANHKDLEIKLELRFQNGFECRKALTIWAIENGRFIHFRRVSTDKCEALCRPPCPWRVYASVVAADKSFMIKTYGGDHSCHKTMNNKLLTSRWIANRYLNAFRVKINMDIKDLKKDVMDRYGSSVSRDKLYKAKSRAQLLVRGSVDQHYASLRRYLAELRRVDRDGKFELLLNRDKFKGLYIGHSSLRKGFKLSCRPLIGLDGCFLKTYLGGILLCAVGKDGNNQMFPIAWAVVSVENEENWTWFMKLLVEDLQITHGSGWTFISDQQKGLMNAVGNIASRAEHRNCARHVYMNWKKQNKGATLKNLFWRAVRCTTVEDYKLVLEEMKKESVSAYQDFIERDVQKFCKAFLSHNARSDMIDNNISETFNGYILIARGMHVIHMCDEIRSALMVRQVKKLHDISGVPDRLCPMIRKKFEKMRYASRNCIPYPALGEKFEVHCETEKFVVTIGSKSCTCMLWDLTGIPCIHGICAIQYLNKDPANYVSEYYTVERYLLAYRFGLEPINGEKLWPEVEGSIIKPPAIKRMPGRSKKNRKKDPEEKDPKNPKRLKRQGHVMTCQNYKQPGHNSKGCKSEKVITSPKEKGKRGRPKKQHAPSTVQEKGKGKGKVVKVHQTSTQSILARERNFAKKGVGIYINEGTGNAYFHNYGQKKVAYVNRGAPTSRTRTTVSSIIEDAATQESINQK